VARPTELEFRHAIDVDEVMPFEEQWLIAHRLKLVDAGEDAVSVFELLDRALRKLEEHDERP
jgi:hypothetical protein